METQQAPRDADLSPSERDLDQRAFDATLPSMESLAQSDRPYLSADRLAVGVLQIVEGITDAQRTDFALLPPRFFDPIHLSDLTQRARAARYAARKLRQARVLGDDSRRRLPPDLVESATALRGVLLQVLDYNVGDDPTAALQLAAIRAGSGYQDLANDLDDLADLYDTHASTLSADGRRYNPQDAAQARALSRQIVAQLDLQHRSDIQTWTDHQARAWTLLLTSYTQARNAALFMWQGDPTTPDRFPPPRALAERLLPS